MAPTLPTLEGSCSCLDATTADSAASSARAVLTALLETKEAAISELVTAGLVTAAEHRKMRRAEIKERARSQEKKISAADSHGQRFSEFSLTCIFGAFRPRSSFQLCCAMQCTRRHDTATSGSQEKMNSAEQFKPNASQNLH